MARLDRAIQTPRVHAAKELYAHLDGPLLRGMTAVGFAIKENTMTNRH